MFFKKNIKRPLTLGKMVYFLSFSLFYYFSILLLFIDRLKMTFYMSIQELPTIHLLFLQESPSLPDNYLQVNISKGAFRYKLVLNDVLIKCTSGITSHILDVLALIFVISYFYLNSNLRTPSLHQVLSRYIFCYVLTQLAFSQQKSRN